MHYWILIIVGILMYRYIGVLIYQQKNFSYDYDSIQTSHTNVPSIVAFFIDKYITKGKANRIRTRAFEWREIRRCRKFMLRAYKEIYFWPWYKFNELYVVCIFEWDLFLIRIKEEKKERTKNISEQISAQGEKE